MDHAGYQETKAWKAQEGEGQSQMTCTKRGYNSPDAAKRAHRKAHYRIRSYNCPICGLWHVTNQEKNY